MNPPFSLLVVHGDGSHVLRLCLPRWVVYGTLGVVALVATAAAGLSGKYAVESTTLRARVDEQRAVIASFQTRAAAIRSEVVAWEGAHERMWEAVGPKATCEGAGTLADGASLEASPTGDAPRVSDELERIATTLAAEKPRLSDLEGMIGRMGAIMNGLPLRWPVQGRINDEYGVRRSPWSGVPERHEGIDIGSRPGTPVESPAAGTVVAASFHGGYGNHVAVDHGNGVKSLYGHLQKLDVKVGQRVDQGQVIGLVGSTGRSTGPHLHYEVLVEGKPVNPRPFLWEH